MEPATCKIILYSDSTYIYPIDSLTYTNRDDTTWFNGKFLLNGYVGIYSNDSQHSFEEGKFRNGRKIGTWRYYSGENNQLYCVANYNDMSELHGKRIYYDTVNGSLFIESIYNHVHDREQGIQENFFASGALYFRYELDSTWTYINDYLVFYENGDTLYHENFGNSGTGWMKSYTDSVVTIEGQLIDNKRDGWWYSYETDRKINQRILDCKLFYKNGILLYDIEYFLKGKKYKGSDMDSIVNVYLYDYYDGLYVYSGNMDSGGSPYKTIYYFNGEILGVEKNK